MNNVLLAIAAVLIAVLAALFAVPLFIDWNGYRGVFEEEASRMLGRDVRVGGNVDVRLLPVPYVSFGKVRIADTANDTGDPFFRADSFTMWLSVPPLLRGALEAREIELKKPVLRLAVDSQGGGNWSTLSSKVGALPFIPGDIALQSVRLRDGAIAIVRTQGGGLAEVGGIDGTLEADSLDGPIRFKGNAAWNGHQREIRFAGSKLDEQGLMRFKANVRVPNSGNTYALDGRIGDLKGRPRLDGELTARIGLDVGDGPARAKAQAERPAADGKALVEADGTGLRLKDISGSLENLGQPQIVSGAAQMSWVGKPALEVRLASRLIDLDRLAGAEKSDAKSPPSAGPNAASSFDLSRRLLTGLLAQMPAEADTSVAIDIDQATLGGDSVSGLGVVVQRVGGTVGLKQLKAGVPGGGRLDLAGTLGPDAAGSKAETFTGDILLRGSSLARFLAWAGRSDALTAGRSDSAFMLQGRLSASDAVVALTEASAELGTLALNGEVSIKGATEKGPDKGTADKGTADKGGARRQINVRLGGLQINAGQIWPAALASGFNLKSLDGLVPGLAARLGHTVPASAAPRAGGTAPAAPQPRDPALDPRGTDLRLRITTPELLAGDDKLTDVDADLAIERGRLTITRLRATTPDKLSLDLSGDLADIDAVPKGSLRWIAAAPDRAAGATLLKLAGLAAADETETQARLAVLAPLHLAGTLTLGQRGPQSTDVTLDGTAGDGRTSATLRLDAAPAAWRTAPLDLTARVEGGDVVRLTRLLVPGLVVPAGQGGQGKRGQALLKATGVPDKGLVALATLDADGLSVSYDGRATLPKDGERTLDGRWKVAAPDARALVAMTGVQLGGATASVRLEGTGTIATRQGETTLDSERLVAGDSTVTGRLSLARAAADKPARIAGDLKVDKAAVAGLLAAISAAPGASGPGAGGSSAGAPWSQDAFEPRVLDGLAGKLMLRVGALSLAPGLTVANAAVQTTFEPGRLDVALVDGETVGGKASGKLGLQKAPSGLALTANVLIDKVPLARFGATDAGSGHVASGTAALGFDVAGQGFAPAAIIAALKGRGEVRLDAAEVSGFTPAALLALADAVMAGKAEREGDAFARAAREALLQGSLAIGGRALPLEVQDGVVRLKQLAVDAAAGRTTFDAAAELPTLKFDAEWRVEARPKPEDGKKDKGPLPPIGTVYSGALKDAGALSARVDPGAFERELTVRKMERDVEELERLRKLDEERIRAEQERQRAAEAERARIAAEERAKIDAAERAKIEAAQATAAEAARKALEAKAQQDAQRAPASGPDAARAAPQALEVPSGPAEAGPGPAPGAASPGAASPGAASPGAASGTNGWQATSTPAPAATPAAASPAANAAAAPGPTETPPAAAAQPPPAPQPRPTPRPKPKSSFPESLFQLPN